MVVEAGVGVGMTFTAVVWTVTGVLVVDEVPVHPAARTSTIHEINRRIPAYLFCIGKPSSG